MLRDLDTTPVEELKMFSFSVNPNEVISMSLEPTWRIANVAIFKAYIWQNFEPTLSKKLLLVIQSHYLGPECIL